MKPKEMNGGSAGVPSAQQQDGGCPTSETQDQHQLQQQQQPEVSANADADADGVMPSVSAAASSASSVGPLYVPNQSPTTLSPSGGDVGNADEGDSVGSLVPTSASKSGGDFIGRTSSPLMATDTPERKHKEKKGPGSSRNSRQSNTVGRYSSSATDSGGTTHQAHQQQHYASSSSSSRLPPRSPVLSNQPQQGEEEEDPRTPAAELSDRLEEASIELVDNLFRFVSARRQEGRGRDNTASAQRQTNTRRQRNKMGQLQQAKKRKMGLTLPASAIGWLSSRMDPQVGDEDSNYHGRITRGSSRRRSRNNGGGGGGSRHHGSSSGRRQSPSDSMQLSERLALLRFHLPQYVEHLRITNEEWPPPPPVIENEGRRSSSGSSALGTNRQVGHQSGRASALNRLSSPRIKGSATPGTPNTQSPGKRNVLARYCVSATAALSHVDPGGEDDDAQQRRSVEVILFSQYARSPQKQAAIRFLLYWHRLQNHPRVDLALFANVRALILDGVLPEWIDNMSVVRDGLEVFRVERACVYDMPSFLLSAKMGTSRVSVPTHAGTRCVANAGEGPSERDEQTLIVSITGKESTLSHVTNLDLHRFELANSDEMHGSESDSESNDCYASLTRLKLSHCAIGECYASDEDGVTGESLSRMPKLESLSLSHNEIARSTTACAGLKNLPQLCALDLSFNRIQSMSNAFLMLGNIRTLVLSWNQISSVDGLDRMYSLERLAIDHNNIPYLQHAAGLANLPELMHLEMKGNPIETNDSRFRVNLLNLFKERRLKLLPKGATYRQLQELLPILDGNAVSPAELVGLKEMTFAPLVQPSTSVANQSLDPSRDQGTASESSAATTRPPMTHADFTVLGPQNGQRGRSSLTFAASPRRIRRRVQTRKANIRSIFLPPDALSDKNVSGQQTSRKNKRGKLLQQHHSNSLSVEDIISALVPRPKISDNLESEKEEEPLVDAESSIDESSESASSGSGEVDEDSFISATSHADKIEPEIASELNELASSPLDAGTNASADAHMASESAGKVPSAEKSLSDKEETIQNGPKAIAEDVAFPDLLGDTDEGGSEEVDKNVDILASSSSADGKAAEDQVKERRPFDFGLAEKKSVYDGKKSYSKLSVQSYLQLYFQTFVFPPALSKGASFYEEEESQESDEQDLYLPRIQLFHSDRELAMKSLEAGSTSSSPGVATPMREKFIDVWTDEIMACGLAATSRLPPGSEALRGFHGEVIRNRGVDELASESQAVLLCLTDAALYFIPDFAENKNNDERRFPCSLPWNAIFSDALWPHALARHPLDYLQRITIGFQFQRLVLHFVLPKRDGQTQEYEYAYVAFTCNKLRTISLVKKLQAQKKALVEQRAQGSGFGTGKDQVLVEELIIDNDDRVVLDSLADAIAPIPMGVVLHYQVLRQKWRSKRPDGTDPVVRRVCVLTDGSIFLLDENYVGDGSTTTLTQSGKYGDATLRLVDSAELGQVTEIRPADEDPTHITLVIQKSRLVRSHRWRLVCKDGESAERLVHDVRQAVAAL